MMNTRDKQTVFDNWDSILSGYEGDPYRRFVMIPTILSLLPNVRGKSLLEIGCGNGILIPLLLKAGAITVVGVDIEQKLLDIARSRLPRTIALYRKNVMEPFSLTEAPFDGAVSNFVLHEVENLQRPLQNIYGQLSQGAFFIMGVIHPAFLLGKWIINGDQAIQGYRSYFSGEEIVDGYHDGKQSINFATYAYPVSTYVNTAVQVGFRIEKMVEPETPQQVLDANPDYYVPYKLLPVSLYLMLRKD